MYASLVEWCRFPVQVYKKLGSTAGGDIELSDPVEYKCYRVDKVKVITDKTGVEYNSMNHFYLPPDTDITEDDIVSFDGIKMIDIRGLNGFYDGTTGQLSIRVVYL